MANTNSFGATPDTRQSLVLRLRDATDAASWEEFVRLYEPLIRSVARRAALQDADAQDVTQQVLLNVARSVQNWQPDSQLGSFRGWLFRITRNVTINLLIQRKRHEQGSGDSRVVERLLQEPAAGAAETAEFDLQYRRQVFQAAAQRVRHQFQQSTWEAFWCSCVRAQPVRDVAAQLGMSVGAVYIARSRVMAKLRAAVQERETLDGVSSILAGDLLGRDSQGV